MSKQCPHPTDKLITTNHGSFCLECGKLTVKHGSSKSATQKHLAHAQVSQAGKNSVPALLSHHKQAVLQPSKKIKVTDLSK